MGISWTMPRRVSDVLKCWNSDTNPSNKKERWKIVPACIWWTVWGERNKVCFEDKAISIQKLKLKCLGLFFFGVNIA